MNGKKAKIIRRLAREEMLGCPDKELVASPRSDTTGMHSPESVRRMTQILKATYKATPTRR